MDREVYVVGFLLCKSNVLLVEKKRPEWQKGLWNGIGGRVEPGESVDVAMRREFREEAGLDVDKWHLFCTEMGTNCVVYFYRADVQTTRSVERDVNDVGETLEWHHVDHVVDSPVVGNLRWLVPMAMDWRGISGTVRTNDNIRERPTW